jgi:hypothetical protein
MMIACGIYDFSLQDITKPTSKRVKQILSALINFAKFQEIQIEGVNDLLAEREQTADQLAQAGDRPRRSALPPSLVACFKRCFGTSPLLHPTFSRSRSRPYAVVTLV